MKAALVAFLLLALPASAQTVLNRGNGPEPDSLDPAVAGSYAETNILGDLMVGLTTLDARGKPIPKTVSPGPSICARRNGPTARP
jgi:oligopeptide transport system substrate-binding protein